MTRTVKAVVRADEAAPSVRLADYDSHIHHYDLATTQLSCGRAPPGAHSTLRAEFVTCTACRNAIAAQ